MADTPSANELHDWLEQLPPGFVDEIERHGDPSGTEFFELWSRDVRVRVHRRPDDSPVMEVVVSAPIRDEYAVGGVVDFETALGVAVSSTPGYSQLAQPGDAMAVNDAESVVLRYPFYDGGATKHDVLTTLLRLADTARQVQVMANMVGEREQRHWLGSNVSLDE